MSTEIEEENKKLKQLYSSAENENTSLKQELAAISTALDREFGPEDKRSGDLLDDMAVFIDHHKAKEEENKRLREAIVNNKTAKGLSKAHLELLQAHTRLKERFDWYKENHKRLVFIPSAGVWQFQYLTFIDLGEAIDKAKALTKPT